MSNALWMFVAALAGIAALLSVINAFRSRGRSKSDEEEPRPSAGVVATSVPSVEYDDEEELTKLTIDADDDEPVEDDTSNVVPIIHDADAGSEEPTGAQPYAIVYGRGQTHAGTLRRRNEDRFLVLQDKSVFVVADGMGGYAGGDVASEIAVEVVERVFESGIPPPPDAHEKLPQRSREIVAAFEEANRKIFEAAGERPQYRGMGTTLLAARFPPNKQRMYVGHVGDSRCYRLRDGELTQMTNDHTMAAQGIRGAFSTRLTRAVGVKRGISVDLIVARPVPGDLYLLCSDGLPRTIDDETIRTILAEHRDPQDAVDVLIALANERGARDNITALLVRVDPVHVGRRATGSAA